MNNKIKIIAENILGRCLSEEDGLSISEIEITEKSLGLKLPTTLRDFYLLVGNLDMFMSSFEQFVEPYMKGDKLVFLEENQSVCFWGVDVKNSGNEIVYMCTDFDAEDTEWYSEGVPLSEFLIILMYYQCAQGGYQNASAIYENNFDNKEMYLQFLTDITAHYQKVVDHNGLVIYQNGRKLIWYFTDEEGNLADTIFASTLTAEEMNELKKEGFLEL